MSDAATVGADPSTSGGTQVHHFCPSKMRRLAAISIVGAAGLVVFAWDLLDPEWIAPQWSAGTALGKPGIGHLVVVALAALPVWMRVPIVMSGAGYLFWAVISRLAHTFDDRPDFLIRPEGVGGWDGFVFERSHGRRCRGSPWTNAPGGKSSHARITSGSTEQRSDRLGFLGCVLRRERRSSTRILSLRPKIIGSLKPSADTGPTSSESRRRGDEL